ncbi:hypothetical protein ILYODFUR_001708 [Ilyodon furcidens]|uniref:Uncharacterized protein n=1 Tax=Ilyodon furcidens TaxID=33524 RepID=A0ABV0UZD7_9TELE
MYDFRFSDKVSVKYTNLCDCSVTKCEKVPGVLILFHGSVCSPIYIYTCQNKLRRNKSLIFDSNAGSGGGWIREEVWEGESVGCWEKRHGKMEKPAARLGFVVRGRELGWGLDLNVCVAQRLSLHLHDTY